MEDTHFLVKEMISVISLRAANLDTMRVRLFLEWLNSHCYEEKYLDRKHMETSLHSGQLNYDEIKNALRHYLEALPIQNLLREYHLLLDEIHWWYSLDSNALTVILSEKDQQTSG